MEYTLKRCKADMIMMWSWLAKTGKNKSHFLEFISKNRAESTVKRFDSMAFECPCCKYTGHDGEIHNEACKKCPITWKNPWRMYTPTCVLRHSEYSVWDNLGIGSKKKKAAAQIILQLAKDINLQLAKDIKT